ncbi:5-oxoprolinase subunit C family protein [Luteipulveratus halotolerans]|uniref:Allophanate hydrolase n=1 Tax=Luteipulveratus halotolerans TaxID=1631356 RepID=A0A0L6CJX7_9MICO|nr:biotin-dependent carboxyltransferase family protein [Luteipulveratus halotolerans]KNX37920.1 allophanate hydrolase [Luteipulveratus halotolerans]
MSIEIVRTGALATVQDLGRPGLAGLGVGVSGAADRGSLRLANRLVGNDPGAAAIEVTFGGLAFRAVDDLVIAMTGAPCPATAGGFGIGPNAPVRVPAGAQVELGVPPVGLRTYVAVRGGLAVEPVLGSRATDTMSGIGPAVLAPGAVLPVGAPTGPVPGVDVAPVRTMPADEIEVRVLAGPRADWFAGDAVARLGSSAYEVTADSNRVGMRLSGPVLERARDGELPSEGMVRGALQVPPTGQPTLFLADHPVTGGYPVIGVVVGDDVDRTAQARPGQHLRFRVMSGVGPQ